MLSHRGYACGCGRAVLCPFEGQFGPYLWMVVHDHHQGELEVRDIPMPVTWVSRTWVEVV